jgi:YebC/PmpR family DNA-binding regulatory protein
MVFKARFFSKNRFRKMAQRNRSRPGSVGKAKRQHPMGRIFEKRKHSIFKTAAQNSKLYSKYSKQLYVAAKNGVPDPEANPALRSLVEKAKRENVPSHVIEKAIQKASGAGGEDFQPVRYEGFGPGGALVIVDCLTDNNTRTISDIRNCFSKSGSKMAGHGSVVMSFDHLAILSFKGDNEDKVLEAMFAADVAVEEVESKEGHITVFAPPAEFYKAKTALLEAFPGLELDVQEITFLPQMTKTLSAEELASFERFLGLLHDCDDVQEIYHNVALPSEHTSK